MCHVVWSCKSFLWLCIPSPLCEFNLPVQVRWSGLEEVCKGKDEVLAAKEQEVAAKERALSDERQRVSSLADECAALKGRLEGKTEEIESLQAHVKTVEVQWTVVGVVCIL